MLLLHSSQFVLLLVKGEFLRRLVLLLCFRVLRVHQPPKDVRCHRLLLADQFHLLLLLLVVINLDLRVGKGLLAYLRLRVEIIWVRGLKLPLLSSSQT